MGMCWWWTTEVAVTVVVVDMMVVNVDWMVAEELDSTVVFEPAHRGGGPALAVEKHSKMIDFSFGNFIKVKNLDKFTTKNAKNKMALPVTYTSLSEVPNTKDKLSL